METIYCSVEKLNGAIGKKLSLISGSMSTSELTDVHSFLKEAKGLREILISMGTFEPPEGTEYIEFDEEEAGEIFFNSFIQACHVIVDMYTLLDDNKVKETGSDWIFDEVQGFITEAQELFGPKVPELPPMRLVSAPKKEPKKNTKKKSV